MPMYRVRIARPTTNPPLYDWMQTVAAADPVTAAAYGYQNWVNSHPVPAAPPQSQCRISTTLSNAVHLAEVMAVSPMQQQFINSIEQQVTNFLSTKLDGEFSMVNYPSGFNYGITYGSNAYYNQATLQDIDTLLGVASNGMPDLTGAGFSNLYAQILGAVTFSFSQQDLATMQAQDTAASGQIASILKEFENAQGTYSNPLPPFGGKLQDVFNQMTKAYGSLSNIPDTLSALRNAIASYKSLAGDSYAMHNRYYGATARIAAAVANVTTPSQANGGMQVSANGYYPGFTPDKLPTANQLIGQLSTSSNAVSVAISISNFTSDSSQMSISGGTSFSIPIAGILDIAIGGSASYNLSRYTSSSSSVTMDITYPGVTLFASIPSVLSTDNTTGWYADDILQEVKTKTGQGATGYQLQGSEFTVSDLFGPGKTFSRLKTFVISQQPTIEMVFSSSNASLLASDLQVNASVQLQLFGLFNLGGASGSYSVQKVDSSSSDGSVKITFGPPAISGSTPVQNQLAYVLGGVASYPPANV